MSQRWHSIACAAMKTSIDGSIKHDGMTVLPRHLHSLSPSIRLYDFLLVMSDAKFSVGLKTKFEDM